MSSGTSVRRMRPEIPNADGCHSDRTERLSLRSSRGLDWLNFFVADVRTGVGPFVAVYLANSHWNAARVGLALTAAEVAGVVTQAPGGALTDRFESRRLLLAVSAVVLTISALANAARVF